MSLSKLSTMDRECGMSCRSRQHGSVLTAAVTKRAVTDAALASFIKGECCRYLDAIDEQGRSLLHMCASRGRLRLLEWLCRRPSPSSPSPSPGNCPLLDARDTESGYTPLHRSVYYGQIHTAVALIQMGASTSIFDNEDLSPLDHCLLDRSLRHGVFCRPPRQAAAVEELSSPCEAYVWGANSNFTTGTGSPHPRQAPELLASFTKQGVYIKQVCLSKFHSLFVGACGGVWSCGHGEGGRLGVGGGGSLVLPSPLPLPASKPCLQAAAARDHSLFLLSSGDIYSCGLNTHGQLGIPGSPRQQLSPACVKLKVSSPRGVRAARYHSVAFSARALYSWGRNGGQLGHPKEQEDIIHIPRKVAKIGVGQENCVIECVAVSDGATVASTNNGDVYLMANYQCRKIATRQQNIKSLEVIGGEVLGGDKLTDVQKQISVVMLTSVGNVYLWQDNTNQFTRCIFSMNRTMVVSELAYTREYLMLVSQLGEAFQGVVLPRKSRGCSAHSSTKDRASSSSKAADFHKFLHRDDCITVRLKRLPNLHRAVKVFSDTKGNNFAVLQVLPNEDLRAIPEVHSSQLGTDMRSLLEEVSEEDSLHDVIIKVDGRRYPAHRYVISHGSEYFAKLCYQSAGEVICPEKLSIQVNDVHHRIFEQVLQFLYTGSCDVTTAGPCAVKILREDNKSNSQVKENTRDNSPFIVDDNSSDISAYEVYQKKEKAKKGSSKREKEKQNKMEAKKISDMYQDPVKLLNATAKKLHISELSKLLEKFYFHNGNIMVKDPNKMKKKAFCFENSQTDLWDTNIKCSDGAIRAHKCILAARLDYFNGMFAHSWTENSAQSNVTLPLRSDYLKLIINFLYTDECPEIGASEDFDFLCNMLVISDQFFISRMREMCEVTFSSLITLRNVPEILQLSNTYNCPQLKKCAMEYICLNLATILESRSLEIINKDLLRELSDFYCEFNQVMSTRVITPFSNAVSDEIVNSFAEHFPVNLNDDQDDEIADDVKKDVLGSVKKKTRPRKVSYTENEKARKRNESTSSITSLDLSVEKSQDITLSLRNISNEESEKKPTGWIKVLNPQQKQQKTVQARLKVISDVKENSDILNSQPEAFIKLNKRDSGPQFSPKSPTASNAPNQQTVYGSPRQTSSSPESFRDMEPNIEEDIQANSQTALPITIVNTKLSQKQRKKLALKGTATSVLAEQLDRLNLKQPAWEPAAAVVDVPVIRNPWQKIEASPASLPKEKDKCFSDIIADERKQKENFSRMMTKPLVLTQMEDKAIEELTRFYNCSDIDDERISVRRVPCLQISAPQWINKSLKTSK